MALEHGGGDGSLENGAATQHTDTLIIAVDESGGGDGMGTIAVASYHQPTETELRHSLIAFYIFLFTIIFAQSALVAWRKRHKRSYELVTLIGLWLIPPIISIISGFWRFILVWFVFSSVTGFFLVKCTFEKAIDKALPKLIYRWFFTVFKTSVAVGSIGYVLILINIFLFAGMAPPIADVTGIALLALWYGLYFGILTRDCAEVASDRIASRLGGARRMAVSVRDCAICGGDLSPDPNLFTSNGTRTSHTHSSAVVEVEKEKEKEDATVQLSCKHLFHKDCLRGWLIVGKKDTCPTCHERVDLRQLYADKPWETSNLQWVQMLDFFRYLVVWQPTILIALNFVFHWLHLDDDGGSDEGIVEVFANTGGGLVMGGNSSVGGNATVGGGLGAVA